MIDSLKTRALGGSPPGSVPIGYWTSIEVMNHLLIRYWGDRAYDRSGKLFYHDAINERPVRDIEQDAQLRTCSLVLWQALCDGVFETLIRKASDEPERFPPDSWISVCRYDLQTNFILGEAFAGWRHDSPLKPVEGGVFLFEAEKVEQWLATIESEHTLPAPLRRAPECLKPEPHVTLAEVVAWLATGTPKTANELRQAYESKLAYIENWLASEKLDDLGDWNARRIELEDFVAAAMAEFHRLDHVCNVLRDLIASGELEAFGCFIDRVGKAVKRIKIDPDVFLASVHLRPMHDQIGVCYGAEEDDYRGARESGVWNSVRFRRYDVTERWSASVAAPSAPGKKANQEPKAQARGPKPKWDWAGANTEFTRLMEENGALSDTDPNWDRQAKIEVAISKWFEDRLRGRAPSESRIRVHVSKWLAAFNEACN